jgi:hypothetical protein
MSETVTRTGCTSLITLSVAMIMSACSSFAVTDCGCCNVLQADTTAKLKEAEGREADLRRSLAAAQVMLASTLFPSSDFSSACVGPCVRTYWGRKAALRTNSSVVSIDERLRVRQCSCNAVSQCSCNAVRQCLCNAVRQCPCNAVRQCPCNAVRQCP